MLDVWLVLSMYPIKKQNETKKKKKERKHIEKILNQSSSLASH